MLNCLDNSADSMKRAYSSIMEFAVVPFAYATWYDQKLFANPSWFSYGYLAAGILAYASREMIAQYKLANPDLKEEEFNLIVRVIDSTFKAIENITHMVFPAIVLDVIYKIKDIFSERSLSIIHPVFLSVSGSYGIYKGLQHFGVFKKYNQQPEVPSVEAGEVISLQINRGDSPK